MSNPTTYQLSTIADIFHKVPAERIEDCLKELATVLTQASATRSLLCAALDSQGVQYDPISVMQFPEFVEWVDDKRGDLEFGLYVAGEENPVFSVKTKAEGAE